ncbi:hypothetical protein Tco_1227353 [Tanacetum coccineum]
MADLEFVDQHNMVACLEKTGGNSEFHEIVDFLTSSSIHHALTVSPTIYISYIEQFWNTASSQTVNDEKQIHATVDSKAVVVTEASIRSSLLLNDVVGTACLTNEAIFQNLALMGYEGELNKLTFQKALFSPQWKKGVKFLGKVTPLFDSMLVPHQAPEGEDQPPVTGSSSSHDTTQDSRDSLEGTIGSKGDQVQPSHDSNLSGGPTSDRAKGGMTLEELSVIYINLSNRVLALEAFKDAQAAKIIKLKTRIKKLTKKSHPVISHHRAWLRSVSRLSMKRKLGRKESVSKQGRKNAKPKQLWMTVHLMILCDSWLWTIGHEVTSYKGRLNKETEELNVKHDTEVLEKGGSNKEPVSAAGNTGVSTVVPEVSIATPMTLPTTTSRFEDKDIFLADALVMLSDKTKLKGVAIKEVKDFDRPKRSILTLKTLSSVDPKDKGKGVLKESPVKKVKRSDLDAAQVAKDAEVERLVYEEELAELEKEKEERQRQEQASVDYIANLYDEVQSKMDASEELAARLQMEEREMYTVEERSRLLDEYFENRKKQLAVERLAAIRNKPPTRTQMRSLMMTYLKHTERDAYFMPIGSEEDEIMIEKMNKKAAGVDEEEVLEEPDSTKVEVKQEGNTESTKKRPGRRLKMKATKKSKRQKTGSDTTCRSQT